MMLELFLPDRRARSVRSIDFQEEYRKGIRGLIFDIDNTLVPHDAPADEETVRFIDELKKTGFSVCLISNNEEARVKPFADRVGASYLYKSGKPLKKSYLNAMKLLHTGRTDTLFVGDQILTDVLGAKRLKLPHILVEPVDRSSDPKHIVFKRKIEMFVLRFCKTAPED